MTKRLGKLTLKAFPSLAVVALTVAGCQAPQKGGGGDFHALATGTFDNVGAVIEEPGVFRIVGGQTFQAPFAIDCTKLDAGASGWTAALAAGAHKVSITLPGQPKTYGGVLALCTIHKSAAGPSSRLYQLVIPASKIPEAADGLIASVAEEVAVNRHPELTLQDVLLRQPGQPPPPAITEDFAWMLWFTDRPAAMGISFAPPGPPPAPAPAPAPAPTQAPAQPSGPKLVKGATYTVTSALNLRESPSTSAPVLTVLNPGDAVVATGDAKNGFWAITTVAGQSGWVFAANLKSN